MHGVRLLLIAAVSGCNLPRDAEHTIDRVRGHDVRVGVTNRPPWVEVREDRVSGIEPSLVGGLARGLNARPSFRRGSESELLEALHRGELDLVAGGLHDDSPWKARVALTKPYHTDTTGAKHVLAIRAGENAWLMYVEKYLETHRPAVAAPETAEQ